MKKIIVIDEHNHYAYDCARIVRIFQERDYDITVEQAKRMWELYSDSMAAGWMFLDDDDATVFALCQPYFTTVEEV